MRKKTCTLYNEKSQIKSVSLQLLFLPSLTLCLNLPSTCIQNNHGPPPDGLSPCLPHPTIPLKAWIGWCLLSEMGLKSIHWVCEYLLNWARARSIHWLMGGTRTVPVNSQVFWWDYESYCGIETNERRRKKVEEVGNALHTCIVQKPDHMKATLESFHCCAHTPFKLQAHGHNR
jgi:hypothetical protein